jgi:hypothetical protein
MEHRIRVINEHDRRTLEWLRMKVGDASLEAAATRLGGLEKPYISTVCRELGIRPPRFPTTRRVEGTPTGNQSIAAIKMLLASKIGPAQARTRGEPRLREATAVFSQTRARSERDVVCSTGLARKTHANFWRSVGAGSPSSIQ